MKKILLSVGIVMFLFGFWGIAGATIYEEKFLFGTEGEQFTGWNVDKQQRVRINFDLSGSGSLSTLNKISSAQVLDTNSPVEDAIGFVPGTGLSWVKLNVGLSSTNAITDPVRIFATFQNSRQKIVYQNGLNLTNQYTEFETYLPRCVLGELQKTGGLSISFISPYWVNGETYCNGAFTLHEVGLSAKVPEPSTFLLLAVGLFSLLGFRTWRRC